MPKAPFALGGMCVRSQVVDGNKLPLGVEQRVVKQGQ